MLPSERGSLLRVQGLHSWKQSVRCLALSVILLSTQSAVAFISVLPAGSRMNGRAERNMGPLSITMQEDGRNGRRNFLGQAAFSTSTASSLILGQQQSASARPSPTTPKVVLWGFGNQNKLMSKYLHERKIPVVGVISRHDVGEDYGMVDSSWGKIGVKTGVKIVDEDAAEGMLAKAKPDVCLMCTRSTMADLQPSLIKCAKAKVNVVTIAEELLDSFSSSPELTKSVDQVFKENGVSVTGSGFIDGACCEMTLALSSMMHRIDALEGGLQYNVDDYGQVLAKAHGVGLSREQFVEEIVKKPQAKSYVYNSNEWFVSALGLTLVETKETREPTTAKIELKSQSINKVIPVGDCTGMKVIATTTTKEGVTIVGKQIGKCYEAGVDQDSCGWGFQGEPAGVRFVMDSPPTPQMTNTAAISRIPQIIDASPGYVTTDKLPIARYEPWP